MRRLASPTSTPTRMAASTSTTCRPVVTSGATTSDGGRIAIRTRVATTASKREGTRWNPSVASQSSQSVWVFSAFLRKKARAARSITSPAPKATTRTAA